MFENIMIVDALRTPFSRFGGALKLEKSIDLGAIVLKEILKRNNLPAEEVGAIYYGTCEPMETGVEINVPGRQALILAGLSPTTRSLTIDSACCSSMDAVTLGARDIAGGYERVIIGMGSENMGRQVYFLPPEMKWGKSTGHMQLTDAARRGGAYPLAGTGPVSYDAGVVSFEQYGITREMNDEWALRSQQRYAKAYREGKFDEEMIKPLAIPQKKGPDLVIEIDEQHRPDTSLEKLAKLKPVWDNPTITAGAAPGINTGASAVLAMSREKAAQLDRPPLGEYVYGGRLASAHNMIAAAPGWAIQMALKETGLTLDDMKLIEINEAFAAMPLTAARILSDGDDTKMKQLLDRTNVNGGAIAIGHPVGASGARLIMALIYELRRRGGGYGIAALCGGLSQAAVCIVKV
ncbi:MAG: thiolase family protein [Desulfatitalea sp.]|nr:thiolase family protein [Desulfatitalea sp.]NNK02555.1 thiolase family protein [Desulfatitalea sp.]